MMSTRFSRRMAVAAAYAGAHLLLAALARNHFGPSFPVAVWDGTGALAFGLVARFGGSWLGLVVALPITAQLLLGGSADELLLRVLGSVVPAAAAMALRGAAGTPDLHRLRPVLHFCGYAAAAATGLAAVHAMVGAAGGAAPEESMLQGLRRLIATLVAILLLAPALILGDPRHWARLKAALGIETLLQAGAFAVIGWEVFGRFANAEMRFFYLLFLPLAWITTRHGQRGASLALAACFLAPLAADATLGHHDAAVVELQIRLLALAATSLLLGAMVGERTAARTQMMARQTELAHVQRLNIGWEMASALAHELNQPLTAAMNYAQAAQRLLKVEGADVKRASEVLGKGIDRIERAGQIIHGLRDFMRKGDSRPVRMTLAEAAEDAVTLVSAEANVAGVVLHTGGLAALPPVIGDKTQVVQILVNLIRNAIQAEAASGTGGVVAISAHPAEDGMEVAVADDGPGIDPAIAQRLFEPFITTKEVGMGLGLSISKSILESHGGRLWAEPGPGGGTVFRFTLPLADKEPADA